MTTTDGLTIDEEMDMKNNQWTGGNVAGGRALEHAEARAPRRTPPTVNTGGHCIGIDDPKLVLDGRHLKIVTPRKPVDGHYSFVDTIRFTTKERAFDPRMQCVTENEFLGSMRGFIEHTFGFTRFEQADKGRDFYLWTFIIGDSVCQLGAISFGGHSQRGTVSVYITGVGCLHARHGWETRLYDALKHHEEQGYGPKITRIDIAYDDYDGVINPRQCIDVYKQGGFDRMGNRPLASQAGNWIGDDPNGKGLTFYVGTRQSSQVLRVYEKGKQLGDPESKWTRIEVQYSSHDRILPLDMIINHDEYMKASYPIFSEWFGHWASKPKRTQLKKKTAQITMDQLEKYAHDSYGKLVNVWRGIGITPEEIVEKMTAGLGPNDMPKRLAAILPDK